MKYKNKIISFFLLITSAFVGLSCQTPQTGNNTNTNTNSNTATAPTVKAQSPTEAYKLLYTAVKAKDKATIKGLMSKGSLGLAEMSAGQQKKSVDQILENGLVAPTFSDSLSEMRDERIKDNFGRVEVKNERENRWEDLPFVLEDGGWKLAVGDLFAGTFDPKNEIPKSKGQIETEASNKNMPMPTNTAKFPEMNSNGANKMPPLKETNSAQVPKEKKP